MKARLLTDARIHHKAGDIVEVEVTDTIEYDLLGCQVE